MSSFTTILCYAIDSHRLTQLLNQSDSTSLVEALRAAGKQTTGAKKKFENELSQHLPFLEKIMSRTPAQDYDPFGEEEDEEEDDDDDISDEDISDENNVSEDSDDGDIDEDESDDWEDDWEDDEPFESEQYADAFEWLCERLGKPIPIPDSLLANSIVGYDYYGFTEALKRFEPPFPLPMLDDAGMLVGFIPKEQLCNFQFKPIDPKRAAEIRDALGELQSIADEQRDLANDQVDDLGAEDLDVTSFMVERAARDFAGPDTAEIELAHDELGAIFADVHTLDKDFIGIIRSVN